jgi:hypothetical protein
MRKYVRYGLIVALIGIIGYGAWNFYNSRG